MTVFKIHVDGEGADDFMKDLQKEVEGEWEVSFDELFPPDFMKQHTRFTSIGEFLGGCGFPAGTDEEFEKIPMDELDRFVAATTEFSTWGRMQDAALAALLGSADDEA